MKEESDGRLLRRVQAGDSQVYARLVGRYQGRLGRYALRMLGNRADAEEALQDAFVRGYRSIARCTKPEGFGPWMFGILVNRCRTYAARRARREKLVVTGDLAANVASVAHSAERDAWRDTIAWALDRLRPDQREAFLLRHVEDLTYEEMRELTGASAATLRMRVFRAREELRRLLAGAVRD